MGCKVVEGEKKNKARGYGSIFFLIICPYLEEEKIKLPGTDFAS